MATIRRIGRCRCGYNAQAAKTFDTCPKCGKEMAWGAYLARVTHNGKTVTKSFALRKDADAYLAKCTINKRTGIELPQAPKDVEWADAVKVFRAELAKDTGLRDSTKRFYVECLPRLNEFFKMTSLLTITGKLLKEYFNSRDCSDARKNHEYVTLLKIYHANCPGAKRSEHPAYYDKLDEIRDHKPQAVKADAVPKFLTDAEITKLRDAAGEQMRLMIDLAIETGLRKANVLDLQWRWINWREKTVTIPAEAAKGKRELCIPLSNELTARLRLFRRKGNIRLSVFDKTNFRRQWEALVKGCGIDATFHALRHTTAVQLIQASVPLPIVSQFLGHADIKTTMIYSKVGIGEKREAIRLREMKKAGV